MNNEASKINDLDKRKEKLIEALVKITDGVEDDNTKSIFKVLYHEAIQFYENNLVADESKLTEQASFMIELALIAHNYLLESNCSPHGENYVVMLINFIQNLFIERLSHLVPYLDFDIINDLSYAEYEKNKVKKSLIAFSFFDLQYVVDFPENQCYSINKLNLHGIRKTLEMLQEDQCLVIKMSDDENTSKYKITGISTKDNVQNCVKVRIDSSGEWTLLIPSNTHKGDSEIIKNKHGRYVIEKSLDICKLLTIYGINKEIQNDRIFKNIIDLIEHLINQRKGASVVYIDDCSYIKKIIEHKRIFIISPRQIDFTILKTFSSIDGAIIFNYQGQCLGYGAILDGEACVDANLQRGSRYNSTMNFVKLHKKSFGIVISDDGMVDVVNNAQ